MTESVGLIDLSSRSKFSLTSAHSESLSNLLEALCPDQNIISAMHDGDIVSGSVVVNGSMSIRVDILKTNPSSYTFMTEADQHTFLEHHLLEKVKTFDDVHLDDVTGKFASFGLIGPKCEELLTELLPPTESLTSIRDGQSVTVDMGYATSVTLSKHFSNSNNGWQILVPSQLSQNLYSMLLEKGETYDIHNIGTIALNSFLMHSSIQSSNKNNVTGVVVDVTNDANWPWGGEPVMGERDSVVRQITSVGYDMKDCGQVFGYISVCGDKKVVVGDSVTVQVGCDAYEGNVV